MFSIFSFYNMIKDTNLFKKSRALSYGSNMSYGNILCKFHIHYIFVFVFHDYTNFYFHNHNTYLFNLFLYSYELVFTTEKVMTEKFP